MIYHSAGDGYDKIETDGGNDTLVLVGETKINAGGGVRARIALADEATVEVRRSNGESIKLKNYMTSNHSVKKIRIGDTDYNVTDIRNLIESDATTVNGTAWGEDIYTTGLNADVYAGAGNDVIHVSSSSKNPNVYVGKGNDVVVMDDPTTPDVNIYFCCYN